jgi:hypothetical protein
VRLAKQLFDNVADQALELCPQYTVRQLLHQLHRLLQDRHRPVIPRPGLRGQAPQAGGEAGKDPGLVPRVLQDLKDAVQQL